MSLNAAYVPLRGDGEELLLPRGRSDSPELEEVARDGVHGRWSHQRNLDQFFRRAYRYYTGKGAFNMIWAKVFDLLSVLFVILVFVFVCFCVDYRAVFHRTSKDYTPCFPDRSLFEPDCEPAPFDFRRLLKLAWPVYGCLAGVLVMWLAFLVVFLLRLPRIFEMGTFYKEVLRIDSQLLQTISWDKVVCRLSEAQHQHRMCITQLELSELEITNMIMRKENYMIGLFSHETINVRLRLPFTGRDGHAFLPTSLDKSVQRVLFTFFFDSNNNVKQQVKGSNISDHEHLARSLRFSFKLHGLVSLLLAPLIIVYRVAVFSFQNSHSEARSALGSRTWTPFARWRLREYCEVEHSFRQRLNRNYKDSLAYVQMFNNEFLTISSRFVTFIFGGLLLFIALMSLIFDDEFFFADLTPHRSVSWWAGVLGSIVVLSRKMIPDQHLVISPAEQLRIVAAGTHYLPPTWVDHEDSADTYRDFSSLFQYQLAVAVEEILGVLITPYMLLFKLPASADAIVAFFHNYTLHLDGIGDVCSFAVFRLRGDLGVSQEGPGGHPEPDAGQPPAASRQQEDKVLHSMISFRDQHPQWQPRRDAAAILEHQEERRQTQLGQLAASGAPTEERSLHDSVFYQLPPSPPPVRA